MPTNITALPMGVRVLSAQYSNTDQLAATTTTNDQYFATTYTLAANTIVTGKVFRVTYGLVSVSTASPTLLFRLRMGSTNTMSSTATAPSSGTFGIGLQFLIMGTAAAGAAASVDFECNHHYLSTAGVSRWTSPGLTSLATNGDLAITLVAKWSATTAGNTVNLRQMIVEALN